MSKVPTKEEIFGAVISHYYSDLDFIEALNNMTYARKVQLKQQYTPNQQNNEQRMDKTA